MTVYDKLRHTAKGSGWLTHHNFKDLAYDISITDARDFLAYDMTERQSPTYYGTIYGNGSAVIKGGVPGYNQIDVNMSTGDQSKFTFVLSGSEAAGEYDFITFTNSSKQTTETPESQIDSMAIRNNARMLEESTVQENSILALNLQIEATNQARMNLVMDKSTGDMIKATGRGSIRLEYNSMDDDMKLYGSYVLEKGSYNFSLQDIITRDFSIKEGSRVSFHGDPMATNLDISAIYSLTANLLDLDETFANDKELTRTTVPVQTILNVAGRRAPSRPLVRHRLPHPHPRYGPPGAQHHQHQRHDEPTNHLPAGIEPLLHPRLHEHGADPEQRAGISGLVDPLVATGQYSWGS